MKERLIHMQTYPLIGIAGNHRQDNTEEDRYILSYAPNGFVRGLEKAKAIPVIIPISNPEFAKEFISRLDGLLLAGGQDVSPLLYGEEPHLNLARTYPARDAFEIELIKEAYRQHKPIFAVCRGLQILNVALGGTLYQDIESQYDNISVKHTQKTMPSQPTHTIQISSGSELSRVLGTTTPVNSYHHQAVKQLASDFVPVAWSTDGLIEAFESKSEDQSVVAVQWHPELLIEDSNVMQGLFDNFVERVNRSKQNAK